jgi:hypothetical protein
MAGNWAVVAASGRKVRRCSINSDSNTIVAMTNLDEYHSDVVKMAAAVASIYIPATAGANPVKDW